MHIPFCFSTYTSANGFKATRQLLLMLAPASRRGQLVDIECSFVVSWPRISHFRSWIFFGFSPFCFGETPQRTGLGSRGVDTGDICEVRTPATCAPISSRSPDRGRFFGSWRRPGAGKSLLPEASRRGQWVYIKCSFVVSWPRISHFRSWIFFDFSPFCFGETPQRTGLGFRVARCGHRRHM